MTYADNATALGKSRNPEDETPVATRPQDTTLPPIPHQLRIRVYDVCPEHGAHTDPELQAQGGV